MSVTTSLFLCGDVMTGRGIDQILPYHVDPTLHDKRLDSAEGYVHLAEQANGPIPYPVKFDYIWGNVLHELNKRKPDARIINLETAVTLSEDWLPKGINYRMHPGNVSVLDAASIDCCTLANNHVLDWGERGLQETLQTLRAVVSIAGAGENIATAMEPAILPVEDRRVLVFSAGTNSSGIPSSWEATESGLGVWLLDDLSEQTVNQITTQVGNYRKSMDLVVFSIHWGSNWGYKIPQLHRTFARSLIDSGQVDLIHGHSSHHPLGVEVYRGKLILYGCGDLINDYEGLPGHKNYRPDLRLVYLPVLGDKGQLLSCELVPMQARNFSLHRASSEGTAWLSKTVSRNSPRLLTRLRVNSTGDLELRW